MGRISFFIIPISSFHALECSLCFHPSITWNDFHLWNWERPKELIQFQFNSSSSYASATHSVTVNDGAAIVVNFTLHGDALERWAKEYDFNTAGNLNGNEYTDVAALPTLLEGIQKNYPNYMKLSVIGQQELTTPLHMLEITNKQSNNTEDKKVQVALIGALKGDEPVGGEILMRFITHLGQGEYQSLRIITIKLLLIIGVPYRENACFEYFPSFQAPLYVFFSCDFLGIAAHDSSTQDLLNTTIFHILPFANPEGMKQAVLGDCTGQNYTGQNYDSLFTEDTLVNIPCSC